MTFYQTFSRLAGRRRGLEPALVLAAEARKAVAYVFSNFFSNFWQIAGKL